MSTTAWRPLIAALLLSFSLPAAAETLSVSQYGLVNADLPWAIALKKGFFQQEGVNIERIIPGQGGGTALRNMLASDLPYGVVATSAALAGIRAGIELKIVSTVSDNIGEIALVVLPDSPLRTIKDLAGKKIAITSPKATTEWMTRMVLNKHGLTAEIVPAGGFAPALTALGQHAVDAAPLNDPGLTQKADKYRVLFAYSDEIPRVTWLVGITTTQFMAKEPAKLRGILKAYRRAVDFLYANREEATRIYGEVWELPADEAKRLLPKYFDMPGEWTHGEFNKQGLETMSQAEMLIGNTDKPIDWNSVVDQSLLPEDLRRPL